MSDNLTDEADETEREAAAQKRIEELEAAIIRIATFANVHCTVERENAAPDTIALYVEQSIQSTVRVAQARIVRLEAALKPFALLADNYDQEALDDPDGHMDECSTKLLGAARKALAKETP